MTEVEENARSLSLLHDDLFFTMRTCKVYVSIEAV